MGRIDNNFLKICVAIGAFALLAQQNAFANDVPLPKSDNNAYTLTKVEQAGENVITKYEWSNSENKYVPVYYRVDLNQTDLGNVDSADSKLLPFNISIKNSNDPNATNFNFDINYYLDENRLSTGRIDGNFSGEDIESDFKDNNYTGSTSGWCDIK